VVGSGYTHYSGVCLMDDEDYCKSRNHGHDLNQKKYAKENNAQCLYKFLIYVMI
jgi:hypothetical protein